MAVPTNLAEALALLTSPSSADKITGQDVRDVVTWLSFGFSHPSETFAEVLTFDQNTTSAFSGSGPIAYSLAGSGHANFSVQKTHLIPAFTATSVTFAPALNLDPDSDAFDPTHPMLVTFSRQLGVCTTRMQRLAMADTVAPEVLYAYVPTADLDTLVVVFSEPVVYTSTTGVTLAFSVGTPRTISSIRGGKGTSEVRFKLSGNVAASDVFTVTFGSGNTFTDTSGNALAAVTVGVLWYTSPADIGMPWWDPSGYAFSSGQWVATYNNGSHLLQSSGSNRPTTVEKGYDGVTTLRFDGTDDYLASTDALSSYISASTAFQFMVAVPRAISTNAGFASQNDGFIGHGYIGIHAKNPGTDDYRAIAYNYSTPSGGFTEREVAIQLMTPTLLRLRHEGGNLYVRRDRAAESAGVASANTDVLTSAIVVGSATTTTERIEMDLLGWGVLPAAPAAHELEGLNTWLMTQPYGGFLVPRLNLPPTLYVTAGSQVQLFWEDVLLTAHIGAWTFETTGTTGSTTNNTKWAWTPATPGSYTLTVTVKNAAGQVVTTGSTSVVVQATTGSGTIRFLGIGDSLMAGVGGAMTDTVRTSLQAAGYTVTMLGTKGGRNYTTDHTTDTINVNPNPYQNDEIVDVYPEQAATLQTGLTAGQAYYVVNRTGTTLQLSLTQGGGVVPFSDNGSGSFYIRRSLDERHEGRAGWSAAHFRTTGNGVVSPFVFYDGVNTTTGSFSFADYITTHLGGVVPTHVVIELGINDHLSTVNADDPADVVTKIDTYVENLERMISGIMADASGVKVGLVLVPPPNELQSRFDSDYPSGINRWQWRRVQDAIVRRVKNQFSGRTNIGVIASQVIDQVNFVNAVHVDTAGTQAISQQITGWVRAA